MFKSLLMVGGVLCLSVAAIGVRTSGQVPAGGAPLPSPRPRLVDSYAGITAEDRMARLDNLAIELQKDAATRAHLIVYGPQGESGGTGKQRLRISIDYLINTRGIGEGQISGIYGGRYKDPKDSWSELWLIPAGAEPPAAQEYESNLGRLKGKFADYDLYDGPADCEGPCLGNSTLAGFADALNEQPDSVAYIVATNQKGANIGTWRRVAKGQVDDLVSRGIASDRIKIIFGGTKQLGMDAYEQQARLQLWILPKAAPPPAKEAAPEEIPKNAIQIGTFSDFNLKYPTVEKQAFEGFADVLKANSNLGVCIIVRPPLTQGFRDPEFPPLETEPPDIDFKDLLEKWKGKLAKDYQIESRRVFVVIASAGEDNAGTIETWIIPPGASLPDPYASDSIDPPLEKQREF